MPSASRIDYTANLSEEEGEQKKEVYPNVYKRKFSKKSRFAEENFERATTTNERASHYEEHMKEVHELKMRIMQNSS